jgi:hypothetical protein
MNCFNHPDVPAVGICKACQKGLCMECVVDLGHGIACKNHREKVEILNLEGVYFGASLVLAPFGFVILLGGSFMETNRLILMCMGLGILSMSTLYSLFGKKLRKSQDK